MKHISLFESFQEFDLESEFDYLNKVLFDGTLERVPLKWVNTKTRSGALVGSIVKQGRVVVEERISHIEISRFFNKTRDSLLGILAHEMIHLWIFQNKIKDDSHHGHQFMKKLRELNDKKIVHIPLKDTVADDTVANESPLSKPVVVFYQHDQTRDAKLLAIIDEKTFDGKAIDSILDTVSYTSKMGKRSFEVTFFKSTDGFLKRYPKTTKFKNAHGLKYVSAPATDVMKRIMDSATIISDHRIVDGKVDTIVRNM